MKPTNYFPKEEQRQLRQMERQIANLERLRERPDLHPYRNTITHEIEELTAEYFGLLYLLNQFYGDNQWID
ncbi:MAG: hypothetical protein SOY62_10270 [Streptococcus orisratti]|nr:hypothetical protein [Streptococcus orisratti]